MSKDFEPIPSEILFLKEKIFSYGCHVFFDIDGTIKGSYTPEAPAGFDPKLPYLLATLNDIPGISVGVCTSQSPKELHSFLLRMDSVIDGKLLIHPQKIGCEKPGLIAAGSGTNFEDDAI